MLEVLRKFQADLSSLKSALPKSSMAQVESTSTKSKVKNLVDYYFREVRPPLVYAGIPEESFNDLDWEMQCLLEHTHKRVRVSKYVSSIKLVTEETIQLEHLCLKLSTPKATNDTNPTDEKIIRTLEALLPSAALSYKQALADLQTSDRFSWRGPATDLREALRETLDHLAPDKDVESQKGFKREADTRGPTMKQKVRFVLSKRGAKAAESATTESAANAVEEQVGLFVRSIYTRSNISTHTPTRKEEVMRVRDLVRVALCELLEIPT